MSEKKCPQHKWVSETKDNQTCYAYCNVRGYDAQLDYHEIECRLNEYEWMRREIEHEGGKQ